MADAQPSDRMRASDDDRERVVDRLGAAFSQGRLTATEFDERVRRAWGAATYGELARVTDDLPEAHDEPARPRPLQGRRETAPADVHSAVRTWFIVVFLNFAVWFVIALNEGFDAVHPWWIWVALVWVFVALLRYGRRRPGKRPDNDSA